MKIYKSIAATIIVVASLTATKVSAALLYEYQTIINITPNAQVDNIDALVIDWTSELNAGLVRESDLEYLSIAFLAGASNLYFDIPIVGGIIQDLGTTARPSTDVFFDFNLDTGILGQISHASFSTLADSSGTRYALYDNLAFPVDKTAVIRKFVDGDFTGQAFEENVVSQSTRLLRTTSVSTPASFVLLVLGLAGISLLRKRKVA